MITTKKEAEKLWDIAVQCACDDINKEQTPEQRKKVIEKFRKTLDTIVTHIQRKIKLKKINKNERADKRNIYTM